jgi:hypothetical protein
MRSKLDYAADGFVWTLDIPATYLVDEVTG